MSVLGGKVAIVTGSGRGIGRAIALRLSAAGAAVVVNDLDDEPARETIALIEGRGGRAVSCVGDVVAPDFCETVVRTALDDLGGLDIVINNAGYIWNTTIQRNTDEQWKAMLDVHATAPFRILRAASEHFRTLAKRERRREWSCSARWSIYPLFRACMARPPKWPMLPARWLWSA